MSQPLDRLQWHPSLTTLIASGLVILGLLLAPVNWGFLVLVALGTLGPGILREFGWLRDKDEFQQRAARRAGFHAYLVTGFIAFLLVAYLRSGERDIKDPEELATFFLALLCFTWFFSTLLSYWGPQKTAWRTLVVFGSAWFLVTVLDNFDDPVAMFMQVLVMAAPFFGLAFLARKWPRVAGVLLIAASVFYLFYLGMLRSSPMGLATRGLVLVLFLGPLVASGVALLLGPHADG